MAVWLDLCGCPSKRNNIVRSRRSVLVMGKQGQWQNPIRKRLRRARVPGWAGVGSIPADISDNAACRECSVRRIRVAVAAPTGHSVAPGRGPRRLGVWGVRSLPDLGPP